MLEQQQGQFQRIEQRQELAPQQIQSLEILTTPLQELEQRLTQELTQNPTLELVNHSNEELAGEPVEESSETENDSVPDEATSLVANEKINELLNLEQLWQDRLPTNPSRSAPSTGSEEEDEERSMHALQSLTCESSLQGIFLEQLNENYELDETAHEVASEIIGSIDDRGYLRSNLADIATTTGVDMEMVERLLKLVQGFDPPGVGARDLRECLMLQLERNGEANTLKYQLIRDCFEQLGRNKLKQVAKKQDVSVEKIRECMREIQQLSPYPGRSAGTKEDSEIVTPEVFITKTSEGEWQVQTNRDYMPRLRISPLYTKMLEDDNIPSETKRYIREKISNSKQLVKALEHRESTVVRIARCLLEYQKPFFEHGPAYLKPLTLSQVAEDLEIHQTTASRAIAGKYLRCPQGVFSFKYFFTSGYESEDGEEVSARSIRKKIAEKVAQEDPVKPLSDQKLVEYLRNEGFDVARRTVAKYREELGILSSRLRKEHRS